MGFHDSVGTAWHSSAGQKVSCVVVLCAEEHDGKQHHLAHEKETAGCELARWVLRIGVLVFLDVPVHKVVLAVSAYTAGPVMAKRRARGNPAADWANRLHIRMVDVKIVLRTEVHSPHVCLFPCYDLVFS